MVWAQSGQMKNKFNSIQFSFILYAIVLYMQLNHRAYACVQSNNQEVLFSAQVLYMIDTSVQAVILFIFIDFIHHIC